MAVLIKLFKVYGCPILFISIEYDWGKKWAEAIGQSLYYSAMTGKKAGIVLIVNPRTKERYLKRLNKAIESHSLNIDVWVIDERF
jgi:hypothetical protein